MQSPLKIFVVEDEMIIAANISLQLTNLGYEVTGISSRGEDALIHIQENNPDIILMDIQLKGDLDGIETAAQIQKEHEIPVIFITANADDAHFNRAITTHPAAFISKPFNIRDLQRAIEITAKHIEMTSGDSSSLSNSSLLSEKVLEDFIFIRHHESRIKVAVKNIFYIEAQRNYCKVYTNDKTHLLTINLKETEHNLPNKYFLRVHRSFIVNLLHIEKLATTYVVIDGKVIPVSSSFRKTLMDRVQTL